MNRRPFSESLFVARCVKVAVCDYKVARCDFVARRASKSQVWHRPNSSGPTMKQQP